MAPQWLLFVGFLGVAGCRGEDQTKPGTRALEGSGSQLVPTAPDVPSRPAEPAPALPPAKIPAAAEAFASETRDVEWAKSTERGIKQRFKAVRGGVLRAAECRRTRCQLTITGTQNQVSQAIADLGGARGLTGFADSVLLGVPERKPDGSLELRAFAVFAR